MKKEWEYALLSAFQYFTFIRLYRFVCAATWKFIINPPFFQQSNFCLSLLPSLKKVPFFYHLFRRRLLFFTGETKFQELKNFVIRWIFHVFRLVSAHTDTHVWRGGFVVVVVEIKDKKSKAKILPILEPLSKRFVPASLLKHVEKIILRLPTTFLYFYRFLKKKNLKKKTGKFKQKKKIHFCHFFGRWVDDENLLRSSGLFVCFCQILSFLLMPPPRYSPHPTQLVFTSFG